MFEISFVDNYEISMYKSCNSFQTIFLGWVRSDNEETINQEKSIDVNNFICV